jgi:hypothetical protein
VAERPDSLACQFAFPTGVGRLPGSPPPEAVTTTLLVEKALHGTFNNRYNSWVTARLLYLDAAG